MSVLCLGEVWLELNAATAPELTETFRAQTGGWGAGFCRQYAALGGQAALLAQLGADPFGRKLAARLAGDGVDCSLLCFTDAFPTPVVVTGEDTALPYRAHTAGLALGPEQLETAPLRGASSCCLSGVQVARTGRALGGAGHSVPPQCVVPYRIRFTGFFTA